MKKYFLPLIVLLLFSCGKRETWYLTQGEIFKTDLHIKYKYHTDLGKEIYACLDSFDLSLNPFNKASIIYKVNHNEAVEVDDWFIAVFNQAQEISRISNGYYDITCAPFINLWGFGYEKTDSIRPEVIDSLKQFVGYEKVRLDGRRVVKADPRLQLNASSIAKGYAVDVIAGLLQSYGIGDYMIEIGGEIRTQGKNPSGNPWSIEILKPLDDATGQIREQQAIIHLGDCALATSGNYRNFYLRDGKKYAHTINPLTGYPAEESILSASVLYPDCMTADAFATAFMAMGLERATPVADSIPQLEYLFIYSDEKGNLLEKASKGFEKMQFAGSSN
ncbi:MAG: FAD:protein FMN transferase [Dysgonamonadaceae bacterium]|jgi:thiamine biosynthesis lipoprotein|nr:FAD:protein FMN transferase [Dysgonamonadaceae bacterium]